MPFPQEKIESVNGGDAMKFQYTKAIVSGIPSSLPAAAQRRNASLGTVDFRNALRQHAKYVAALKNLGLQIIELPADEDCPDCVFVEDTAVVCDGVALVTRLGHSSRRGESIRIKKALVDAGLSVLEMEEPAALDGGDVLFTGKEFLVGLSERTNQQGLDAVSKAFPNYPVTGITVKDQLHLKCIMTMAAPDTILVGGSDSAEAAWNEVQKNAKFQYEKLMVLEDKAANCVFVNDALLHLSATEIPGSYDTFKQLPGEKIELENSELHKVDGSLSCLSILI